LELSQAESEFAAALDATESEMAAEKGQALAAAAKIYEGALTEQKSALEKEKQLAVADTKQVYDKLLDQEKELTAEVQKELLPYVEAVAAKQKIVEQLAKNFGDVRDSSAVEIDEKSGRVRLNFQESYFTRGSHELSEDMKDFLRIVIPKYAKSIYSNQEAAAQVQSLKISGMTSPVYQGRYIDINDTSPATARARKYNMALSNKRAVAMYNFIFDEDEMGDYKYRDRMKTDMTISAVGYKSATPVPAILVGKPAKCEKYDCKQEQATILQFNVFTED
jgi:flagellar motor protein MotB